MSQLEHKLQEAADQKALVHAMRAQFFADLLREWARTPERIDVVMGQNESFLLPDYATARATNPDTIMINDIEHGLLAASVTPSDQEGSLRWVYSVLQAGDWLRWGILVQGSPKQIVQFTQHHDALLSMERVWDRQHDYQFRDDGGVLFEWRFYEPTFYNDFAVRERMVIMARHFHFRLGKISTPLIDPSDSDNSGDA